MLALASKANKLNVSNFERVCKINIDQLHHELHPLEEKHVFFISMYDQILVARDILQLKSF
jgi:hypothetical protein